MIKLPSSANNFCFPITLLALCGLMFAVGTNGWAQDAGPAVKDSGKNVAPSPPSVQGSSRKAPTMRLGEAHETIWEFGLKIQSKGVANGITATAPIPVVWPEQEVEIVGEEKTGNVSRISIKRLNKSARQMLMKVKKLGRGEVARAVVKVKIKKRHIAGFDHSENLVFPKEVPSRLKQFLKPSPFIESDHPQLKAYADKLVLDRSKSAYDQVEQIYSWVQANIEYEFDTQIRSCLEALVAGKGDCEELSSMFIAICRIKGIPARAVWIPDHTYPEFYLEDANGKGHWIPCQIAGTYEFGAMSEDRPILQKGDRFKMPGEPKPVRYIKPTLVAKDASGAIKLSWIAHDVNDPDSKKEEPDEDEGKSIFDR